MNNKAGAAVLAMVMLAALLLAAFLPFGGDADAAASSPAFEAYGGFGGEDQRPAIPGWYKAGSLEAPPASDLLPSLRRMQSVMAASAPVRYEQTDPRLVYTGTWTTSSAAAASGGSFRYANSSGSSVTVCFKGTQLSWIAKKSPAYGKARVTIDGGVPQTVDLYSAATLYQQTVWNTGTLAPGLHTVTIEWTGTRNSSATNYNISVDAFNIVGAIAQVPAPGFGNVSGGVTTLTGTALQDVVVGVFSTDWELLGYDITDATGSYAITGLPRVRVYVLTSNGQGYIDEWYDNVIAPGNWEAVGATALDLASGPNRTGISFQLALGKSISGMVTDSSANSAGGVFVEVYDLSGVFYSTAEVDYQSGAYQVGGLPAGRYRICTWNDVGFIDEWYDNIPFALDPEGATATIIDIRSANATNRNFRLDRGRSVSGIVSNSAGTRLEGVEVRVQPTSGGYSISVLTDDTGRYQVIGLYPTTYVVNTANDQGYVDEWYDNKPAPGNLWGIGATPVNVTSRDATAVDFVLDRGYTISGTVVWALSQGWLGEPMFVEVMDAGGRLFAIDVVGAAARIAYTTWALPAGTYYAKTTDYLVSSFATEWYDDLPCALYDLADATPISVAGADVTGVDFRLDSMNYYEQTDTRIVYSGNWSTLAAPLASNQSYIRANAPGSSATIYFTGISLDWVAMMGTTTGKADVYVDDVLTDTIDLAAATPAYQVLVWTSGDLPRGRHKVQIVWNAGNAAGKYITVDAVRVDGVLTHIAPKITSINPSSGPTVGGNPVVITGQGFTGATAVTFGGTSATSFVVNSATQITAVAPARPQGTVQVRVTTPSGTTGDTVAANYTYTPPVPPTITSLSPTSGPTTGGTSVTISGTGFHLVTSVLFGETPATSYVVDSPTKITAVSPARAQGTVGIRVTAAGGTNADTTADDFTYVAAPLSTRYEQTNANIVKTGTWADFAATGASGGSYGRSSTAGASATIHFTGARLDWVAMKGTTTGIADVYLDGVKKATIDLAASSATYKVTVWSTGTLANGPHTVRIVRNSGSAAGKYLTLDAVDIWGTLTAPPPVPTRYEQTNANIIKTGTWADFAATGASGGSYGRSSTAGASATIRFTGTRLDWIAMKGTTTGIADVYLDGVKKATIDLAASSATYKVTVWSTGTLANGPHTVRIVRNSGSAAGKYLTLDAVDIWGTISAGP